MKFLVTKKWVVEVSNEEMKRYSERAGRELDPRQIAIYKAIEKLVELLHAGLHGGLDNPADSTQIAFEVEPWEGVQ